MFENQIVEKLVHSSIRMRVLPFVSRMPSLASNLSFFYWLVNSSTHSNVYWLWFLADKSIDSTATKSIPVNYLNSSYTHSIIFVKHCTLSSIDLYILSSGYREYNFLSIYNLILRSVIHAFIIFIILDCNGSVFFFLLSLFLYEPKWLLQCIHVRMNWKSGFVLCNCLVLKVYRLMLKFNSEEIIRAFFFHLERYITMRVIIAIAHTIECYILGPIV